MSPILDIELMRRRHLKAIMPIEDVVYPRPWSIGVFNAEIDLAKRGERYYVEDAIVMWCHDISSPEMAHRLRAIEEERTRIAQGSVK